MSCPAGCGAATHPDCGRTLGACPTLGCAGEAERVARPAAPWLLAVFVALLGVYALLPPLRLRFDLGQPLPASVADVRLEASHFELLWSSRVYSFEVSATDFQLLVSEGYLLDDERGEWFGSLGHVRGVHRRVVDPRTVKEKRLALFRDPGSGRAFVRVIHDGD